ncbi:50S ribosomal protein L13 [Cerasicoccus arenae]|uniref:Large ribosomal subunit protein uL13 n=1 Tax=Cerasicoccus arenae TaxID=424488 RepID=A0A8J3DCN3_9BACT|nr:50S ribosomal protein L13 [Cerasicoccus arenae]MBK1856958.1 50S ribosomal protein L13 [Cerasicoccus arenae]GHB90051.1 50S ribosomal protein L13 [Cerasicoccus arenae]
MKTTLAKIDADKKWVLVDAEGKVLGRLAVEIANIIRGRHKPLYTPHLDTGDYVVVINAEKVVVTGKKEQDKQYMFHTGWVGNEYRRNVAHFREKKPAFLIENAVKGMLPRNKLARHMMSKLKVYAGTEHPHEAQNPQPLSK